jgi:hypothetical protein
MFTSGERKRLYKEAKTFLKVRAMRNKLVKDNAANGHGTNGNGAHGGASPSDESKSQPQETLQV